MTTKQRLMRKKENKKALLLKDKQPQPPAPEEREALDSPMLRDQSSLDVLQAQAGNLAVQSLLRGGGVGPGAPMATIQRQMAEEEAEAKAETAANNEAAMEPEPEQEPDPEAEEPVEVGEITVEEPEIETYEIQAESLEEAVAQIEPPEDWYQYEYEHDTKTEDDVVIEANITVKLTIRLPDWSGPGREQVDPREAAEWERFIESFQVYEDEHQAMSELPPSLLQGAAWEEAPDALKNDWRSMLEDFQKEEESLLDTARRRALVLQQRLLNQLDQDVNTIVDQFIEDMETEEEEYARQREAGEEPDISVSGSSILQ